MLPLRSSPGNNRWGRDALCILPCVIGRLAHRWGVSSSRGLSRLGEVEARRRRLAGAAPSAGEAPAATGTADAGVGRYSGSARHVGPRQVLHVAGEQ